jgi:hypothetical protein
MLIVSLTSAVVLSACASIAALDFFTRVFILDLVARLRSLRSRDFLTSLTTDFMLGNYVSPPVGDVYKANNSASIAVSSGKRKRCKPTLIRHQNIY